MIFKKMFRFLLKLFLYIFLIVFSLLSICVLRYHLYFSVKDSEIVCQNYTGHKSINYTDDLFERFSKALQFKTITKSISNYNATELVKFTDWIQKTYPNLHKAKFVKLEKVSKYSLLYTIQGSDKSLKPYLLCSHLDVVPVIQDKWTENAFGGKIKDGYLYGRGTIDVKDSLIGILESIEYLIKVEKFVPKRTILLAFGHDEEGSGFEGAFEMSRVLQDRYKNLEYIFDEGTFIMKKSLPGVNLPVAFVSVGEKGYLTLELTAKGEAGHSSIPTYETAINKLAKALSKINSNSFPSFFGQGPEVKLLETLSSKASFPYNYVYSNLWLFWPIINKYFSLNSIGNSLIRTTTAVTMISGGIKDNILPIEAKAVINHRIHPLQTVNEVSEYIKTLVNDKEIDVSIYGVSFEPQPLSPYDQNAFGYNIIRKSINEIFENVLTVPTVMLASTDTKHYQNLSRNIYRFTPILLGDNDINRFHGHNERIELKNYHQLVNFYCHVIIASDKANLIKKDNIKDEL